MSVVTVEDRGPVTIIAINRPEKLNAINKAVAVELQQAFAEFDRSAQRVAVLTGAGERAFSSGADVTDLPELWRCVPTVGITTEKPIIAAVSGWCIGGGLVMAMMCDLLVAAENARFSYPEGKVGITGGMIAGLAARIPHKIAMEIMLLGEPIDAERAYAGRAGEPDRGERHGDRGGGRARPQDGRSGAAGAGDDEAFRERSCHAKRPGRAGGAVRRRTRRGAQQRRRRGGGARLQGETPAALSGPLTGRPAAQSSWAALRGATICCIARRRARRTVSRISAWLRSATRSASLTLARVGATQTVGQRVTPLSLRNSATALA